MTDTTFNVNELGIISVDTSNLKKDVETSYTNVFGNTFNLSTSTPQGQLIESEVVFQEKVQENLLDIVNSFSLIYATGDALDRAGAFYGYYRKSNTPTIVNATLYGTTGTIVYANSIVSDGNYNYKLLENVTIIDGGSSSNFECLTSGNITCLANTLNTIITTTPGWDSINNDYVGINGIDTESDNTFRQRATANTLNIQAKGLLTSIIDNIAQLNDVLSVVGRENYADVPQTIDGVYMKAHSIFLTILGGNGSDIAEVINKTKTSGTSMNGDVIVSYYDSNINYVINYVIYRPAFTNISIQVNYSRNNYTPADIDNKIKETLLSYINTNPFMIGSKISGNDLAKAFNDFIYMDLLSIKVKLTTNIDWYDYISLNLLQIAVLDEINIEIQDII